jgi:tRNA-dihydrouridine synthase
MKTGEHLPKPTLVNRVEAAKNHLQWAMDWKGEKLGILETRRHYTNYFKGLPNFKEYRMKMVSSENPEYIFQVFEEVLQKFENLEMV